MSYRSLTIKNLKNESYSFNVPYDSTFQQFVETIKKQLDTENDIKLMFQGNILNDSNFNTVPDKASIIFMVQKYVSQRPVSVTTNSSVIENNQDKVDRKKKDLQFLHPDENLVTPSSKDVEPLYNFEEIRASMIVMLNFVRENSQIRNLFENDFGALTYEMLNNEVLVNITKNIIKQSGNILHAIKTGGNIAVNVDGDNGDIGNVSEQSDGQSVGSNNIELTSDDEETIADIIEMGFEPVKVIEAYLVCNKNVSRTIEFLTSYN